MGRYLNLFSFLLYDWTSFRRVFVRSLFLTLHNKQQGNSSEAKFSMLTSDSLLCSHLIFFSILALTPPSFAEEPLEAYLRSNDIILTVGDSVTAQGVYQDFMQSILDTLYPGKGIRVVNAGTGGMKADGGITVLNAHLKKTGATVVTVMFGVNDTMWNPAQAEAKAKTFAENLSKIIDIAQKNKVPVVLLRESHFSHGKKAGPWIEQMNKTLETILAAGDKMAAERKVPVIDVLGAYRKALAEAWTSDPKYEFTPDVIHPIQPGHAAIAAEILGAFGAGLPLAKKIRGPIRGRNKPPVRLTAVHSFGIVPNGENLPLLVHCTTQFGKPVKGEGILVAAGSIQRKEFSLKEGETGNISLPAKPDQFPGRWGSLPMYTVFSNNTAFHANHTLLHYSRITNTSKALLNFVPKDFKQHNVGKKPCPVSDVSVSMTTANEIKIRFQWNDETVVPAKPGFKTRFGKLVKGPLDLESRGGQPCDAIEFYFDLRSQESAGRPTSNADANPDGVVRLGAYIKEENGRMTGNLAVSAGIDANAAKLEKRGENLYELTFLAKTEGSSIGFTIRITDTEKFGPGGGRVYDLTGRPHVSLTPLSFIRISPSKSGIFFRVGY